MQYNTGRIVNFASKSVKSEMVLHYGCLKMVSYE